MTKKSKLFVAAALMLAVATGSAEAAKGGGKPGGGGGGVPTNYGCQTFAAGKTFYNLSGGTKRLLISTYTCYLCNTTTRVCTVQSPSTLAGWLFNY
jgi:hypothetical protein